ncbi:MAG: prepilin-type N-terminal cleavage/methylation domain-containing protein [Phycisphaerales bacterium]|nr:prepilin-type N-terminal cleavage/methylation domain-containing protein [Phycisphaerales bacterium]
MSRPIGSTVQAATRQAQVIRGRTRGFTLVELLTVVTIIAMLVGLVLAALTAVRSADHLVTSRHHLRQIAQWMDQWSTARNDVIVPASFDTRDEEGTDPGVTGGRRFYTVPQSQVPNWADTNIPWIEPTGNARADGLSQGTWADILWVDAGIGDTMAIPHIQMEDESPNGQLFADTRFSQPGRWLYQEDIEDRRNPLRSTAANSENYPRRLADYSLTIERPHLLGTGSPPKGMPFPMGAGAWEKGLPGFFAANNFFEGRSLHDRSGNSLDPKIDPRWTIGQIKAPSRSVYLVDSIAGETIGGAPDSDTYRDDTERAFSTIERRGELCTQEVDFRYDGQCLVLKLDGSTEAITPWGTLEGLQGEVSEGPGDDNNLARGKGIRVTNLHRRLPW